MATQEDGANFLKSDRQRIANLRANETDEQYSVRFEGSRIRIRMSETRANEIADVHDQRDAYE